MWAQNKDFGAGLHTDFIRSLVLSVLQAIYISVALIFSGFTRSPVHICSPNKVYTILARLHFWRWRRQGWKPSAVEMCLNWNYMLIKLGLSGLNHRWIESFPVNCEQSCKVLARLHLFTLLKFLLATSILYKTDWCWE